MMPVPTATFFFSHGVRRRGREAIRRLGYPICTKCLYDLKAIERTVGDARCPECGALIADMPPVGSQAVRCDL